MVKICAAIASLLCAASACAQRDFPPWFLRTLQISGVHSGVGYAASYARLESSYDEAFQDAAWRLFVDREAHFQGEAGFLSSPAGKVHLGDTFRIEADTAGFAAFRSSLLRLDSALVGDLALLWVSTSRIAFAVAPPPSSARPAWLEKLPEDGEHIYALGMAATYAHPESSWREAERRARIELALNMQCRVQALEHHLNFYGERVSTLETDVILHDVQTLARWKDPRNGACWVLVRCNP